MKSKKPLSIVFVKLNELKPSEYNPRKMSPKQAEELKESLRQFGFVDPLVVNRHPSRENVVVGGHMRLAAAKELGLREVPVVYVDLDEKRERELNLRLNRNIGEWENEGGERKGGRSVPVGKTPTFMRR